MAARGWQGERNGELVIHGDRVSAGEEALEMEGGDGCTTM